MSEIQILTNRLKEFDPNIRLYSLESKDVVFEERVLLNCFYCSKYNANWTCPPRIPKLNYAKILSECSNTLVLVNELDTNENDDDFENIRMQSSNQIHKALLALEKVLWEQNHPLAISFTGGSCKLCKNGCADDKCRNPGIARIPVEATGINLIKTLEKINISIKFPISKTLSRCALLCW